MIHRGAPLLKTQILKGKRGENGEKGEIFAVLEGKNIIFEKGEGSKNILFWANIHPCKIFVSKRRNSYTFYYRQQNTFLRQLNSFGQFLVKVKKTGGLK